MSSQLVRLAQVLLLLLAVVLDREQLLLTYPSSQLRMQQQQEQQQELVQHLGQGLQEQKQEQAGRALVKQLRKVSSRTLSLLHLPASPCPAHLMLYLEQQGVQQSREESLWIWTQIFHKHRQREQQQQQQQGQKGNLKQGPVTSSRNSNQQGLQRLL